jgi:hypothetical protein
MTILIIGGTGTLGRQIVKKALDEGYLIKCLVRNFRRSVFLKDWGSDLVYGDLAKPSSIPLAFKGVRIVVDSATSRLFGNYNCAKVEGFGRLAILEISNLARIKKYIWFTLFLVEECIRKDQPLLLRLNARIREMLQNAGELINFTYIIFECLCFFQGLIKQYAIPILEGEKIWVPSLDSISNCALPYIDTRDAAKSVVHTFNSSEYDNTVVSLINLTHKGRLENLWTSREIIQICERLSGKTAETSVIPDQILVLFEKMLSFFEASWNIGDGLSVSRFYAKQISLVPAELMDFCSLPPYSFSFRETWQYVFGTSNLQTARFGSDIELGKRLLEKFFLLELEPREAFEVQEKQYSMVNRVDSSRSATRIFISDELVPLEFYLADYFGQIVKKLREINYQDRKSNKISFL